MTPEEPKPMQTNTNMKTNFGYKVTADQRRKHIAELEKRLAQLDAVNVLPEMPLEWFIHGGIGPAYLALEVDKLMVAMGVTADEAPHLGYYAEHTGHWYDDGTKPDPKRGESVWNRITAKYGDMVNPTTIKQERSEITRKLSYENWKLSRQNPTEQDRKAFSNPNC